MLLLTLRTDKPEAEIGLYDDDVRLRYETWSAHRELAETLHLKIASLIKAQQTSLSSITGIILFQGPGSFTGLRIGFAVANALAASLGIPIVACRGVDWIADGYGRLTSGDNDEIAVPEYGALPHITVQKK